MELKALPLRNAGMNRDDSISKVDSSAAYENRNIRITIDKDNTLLSVTNERGNVLVPLDIEGVLIGWNVLNNYLVLFTSETESESSAEGVDRIYRVKYADGEFTSSCLFSGHLKFDQEHPIESVVDFESEDIQKIYWVDGKNVLRFMNFSESQDGKVYNDKSFDTDISADCGVSVSISKDFAGNTRNNGTVQYLLTYYNKFGQQTGMVWASDLVYLSPAGHGGSPDGTNTCRVTLSVSGMDQNFTNFRVYSIYHSSLGTPPVGYLVYDGIVTDGVVNVVDDGAHLETFDVDSFLFLGSYSVKAGTLTHKDGTLFLGDLRSVDRKDYSGLEKVIRDNMFKHAGSSTVWTEGEWESLCITFQYSDDDVDEIHNIPYVKNEGNYQYNSQLELTSSEICSFKGGEKYRFALVFKTANGVSSDAFWIGDATNGLYPIVDASHQELRRIVAKCKVPAAVIRYLKNNTDFVTLQLHIAEATYADRSVKAQGIVNPTMFNVWDRYNEGLYSQASWISRLRRSGVAWRHFEPVHNSTRSTGEIQCNYWTNEAYSPAPYYQLQDYYDPANTKFYVNSFDGNGDLDGESDGDYLMLVYMLWYGNPILLYKRFHGIVYTIKAKLGSTSDEDIINALKRYRFSGINGSTIISGYDETNDPDHENPLYTLEVTESPEFVGGGTNNKSRKNLFTEISKYLIKTMNVDPGQIVNEKTFKEDWCSTVTNVTVGHRIFFNQFTGDTGVSAIRTNDGSISNAFNWNGEKSIDTNGKIVGTDPPEDATEEDFEALETRWYALSEVARGTEPDRYKFGSYMASFYKQHLMFVDENVVTLDSPEISYGALNFDNADYRFRIVGVSRFTSGLSDYKVDATQGKQSGTNLLDYSFNWSPEYGTGDGIISWPLWQEYGLSPRTKDRDGVTQHVLPANKDDYTSDDYKYQTVFNRYWLHMWNRSGDIDGYSDSEDSGYSVLKSKTFANLKYSYDTVFNSSGSALWEPIKDLTKGKVDSLRMFDYVASQYLSMNIGDKTKYYDAYIDSMLTLPGSHKYPILYSRDNPRTDLEYTSNSYHLKSATPIPITYATNPHAVISLPSYGATGMSIKPTSTSENPAYTQTILPMIFSSERVNIPVAGSEKIDNEDVYYTDAMCPWLDGLSAPVNYMYATPRYDGDTGIIPDVEVIKPYDKRTHKATLKLKSNDPNTWVLRTDWYYVWVHGFDYFGSGEVYFSVPVEEEDGKQYYYVIDVSGFEYNAGVTAADDYLLIDDANVISRAEVGDESTLLQVYGYKLLHPITAFTGVCLVKAFVGFAGVGDIDDVDDGNNNHEKIDWIDDGDGDTPEPVTPVYPPTPTPDPDPGPDPGPSPDPEQDQENKGGFVLIVGTNELKDISYLNFPAYKVKQDEIGDVFEIDTENGAEMLTADDSYLYIGEIYQDFSVTDTRYGGTSSNDAERNTYVAAGPQYLISDMSSNSDTGNIVYANQGDTYFQRWDCMRTKPFSESRTNGVIDITSFMVETHINIDGRYDLQRGIGQLASLDTESYGQLNPVYSQQNDFFTQVDQDEKYNLDTYRSSITWTLEKSDAADIDEWTHITLANTLKLDGDKGICRALRRFQNSLIAFQDRGISEILFNSRTQLSTTDGVPVELANSGKVDGKRYITNKFGCLNKWSITEGKAGLYFVDNINRIFARIGGNGIENISSKQRFDAWFRRNNSMDEWNPKDNNNFVSFYDGMNSDVYLLRNTEDADHPCLVFNEQLDAFTSFFDYDRMSMLTNIEDKLVSWKNGLWVQNEGKYLNFFGHRYPFSVTYRAVPDPYNDKIWTGLEYRADFYDTSGQYTEDELLDSEKGLYVPDVTFDYLRVWNEYQSTEPITPYWNDIKSIYPDIRKRFRKWSMDIPRAKAAPSNRFGLDRIRNPWVFINLVKEAKGENDDYFMQMHDMIVKYFE